MRHGGTCTRCDHPERAHEDHEACRTLVVTLDGHAHACRCEAYVGDRALDALGRPIGGAVAPAMEGGS